MREIFVFGSNLAGRHTAGAALYAYSYCDAIYGQGIGLQGNSYAIPTKDYTIKTLPLEVINKHVKDFIKFAAMQWLKQSDMLFKVTPIGCGLAGYSPEQIAPMFAKALEFKNIKLPSEFLGVLNNER